ncbi:MAG: molybdopterin-dependent oxidoreductase [Spongiibacteraceae bacterium]
MAQIHSSLCRVCPQGCALRVEVNNGCVTKITGDKTNPLYRGYICVKGSAQVEMLQSHERLLSSYKRLDNGTLQKIPVEQALDEIAEKLRVIIARDGPRAVATYLGTYIITTPLNAFFEEAFARALGTPMRFAPATIDKPGKYIAKALLGSWMAPAMSFHDADVALLIGINPFVAYQGFPLGNPVKWFKEVTERGMKTLVIDPRRTEVARRAHLHLQPRAGEDLAILAGMLRLILRDDLYDHDFVAAHVEGLEQLRAAVEAFTPELVAARADIDCNQFIALTRMFASAKRGYVIVGTGPNMSGPGTLIEYLAQVLDTICGNWMREGEKVPCAGVLTPVREYRAQAQAPTGKAFGFGEKLRVRNLTNTAPGMPSSAMAEEMLLAGEGRVRALISVNGNPAAAFPDQLLTIEALKSLELLVQVDPWLSQTAQLAHYVIAPKMPLEMPSNSYFHDYTNNLGAGYGTLQSYAQYAPALVEPPAAADVIEEWQLYFRLAQKMQLALTLSTQAGPVALAMDTELSADELLELLCRNSRVPLAEVKKYPGGAIFNDATASVLAQEKGWTGRFQVGDRDMMRDLDNFAAALSSPSVEDVDRPFRLISRRLNHVMNSACNNSATHRGKAYNPAYMHPGDMAALGLATGDAVSISSARATIPAIVEADATLRRGLISMTHAFGGFPEDDDRFRELGSCTGRLTAIDDRYDCYSGQPRMSAIPVAVRLLH